MLLLMIVVVGWVENERYQNVCNRSENERRGTRVERNCVNDCNYSFYHKIVHSVQLQMINVQCHFHIFLFISLFQRGWNRTLYVSEMEKRELLSL